MIDVKQIRIGNWVHFDNKEGGKYDLKVSWLFFGSSLLDYYSTIPITEDWLLRLGFEKVQDLGDQTFYDHPITSNFQVVFDDGYIALHFLTKDSYISIFWDNENFQFIHQLQNVFYSMTGEELTIK